MAEQRLFQINSGEKVDRGLLNKILKKDLQISREEFENLL